MTRLLFCQNDSPMGGSFWQKDSLITDILFGLCLLWYLAHSQILGISLYVVPVKSKVKILQNFVAFSEYINFKNTPSEIIFTQLWTSAMNMVVKPLFKRSPHKRSILQSPIELEKIYLLALLDCTINTYFLLCYCNLSFKKVNLISA